MSRAHLVSIAVFLVFQAAALVLLAEAGMAAFVIVGLAGCVVSGLAFKRLSTPEEKRRDLEDRVRNPP